MFNDEGPFWVAPDRSSLSWRQEQVLLPMENRHTCILCGQEQIESQSKKVVPRGSLGLPAPPLAVEANYGSSTKPFLAIRRCQAIQLQSGRDLNANHSAGALPASELNLLSVRMEVGSPYFLGRLCAALHPICQQLDSKIKLGLIWPTFAVQFQSMKCPCLILLNMISFYGASIVCGWRV